MIWCCPRCRGELADEGSALRCEGCSARYEVIAGIPDFRDDAPTWIDVRRDREAARALAARADADGVAGLRALVRAVFGQREGAMSEQVADLRTSQVLDAPARLRVEVGGWLDGVARGTFLDLGCGPGMLLAAAALHGRRGIGVDVCLTWLVVASRLIALHGGVPVLAAAFAEALPLADRSVDGVVALDVVEHVADPVPFLREIDRVTAPGGALALATPNRFSLAAEPHVFVWGVGWLPRRWQCRYVRWRSGKPYDYVRLLSPWELRRLVGRHTAFSSRLLVPPVPDVEIARFPARRAALARAYNRIAGAWWSRPAALGVGPFFRLVGRRVHAVG